MRSAWVLLVLWLWVGGVQAQAVDPLPFADRAEEQRFQKLAHELRCVQCQNNSLADSDGMIARDVRHEVFRLMREGLDDEGIKQHLVDRYGEFVLFKPRVLALYVVPVLLLVLAAGVGVIVFLRRARATPAVPAADEEL